MPRSVALLRGINIGPHKKVPMKELRALMEGAELENVSTVLATGNVIFDTEKELNDCEATIEAAIEKQFGFSVGVQVRLFDEFVELVKRDPFQNIPDEKHLKRYVTFLPTEKEVTDVEGSNFQIVEVSKGLLLTVVDLSKQSSVDLMAFLDKTFGKTHVTTRNWNTVVRVVEK